MASSQQKQPQYSKRATGYDGATVWDTFTPLARETSAVNLGQGFPDWKTPDFIKQAGKAAIDNDFNQYTRSSGHPPLTQTLATRYSAAFGRTVNEATDICVTSGASEAMYGIMQGLLNDGDEVVTIEPFFDNYKAQIELAGGKMVTVALQVADNATWQLDIDELASAITDRTRVLLLNTPHNPTGKVFTKDELQKIADIVAARPNLIVVTDEVYEHMLFDDAQHSLFANLPGMWDRTVTISSAGKTFSVTGWKIGWAVGPSHLIKPLQVVHQYITWSISTPCQQAIADTFDLADKPFQGFDSYYAWLHEEYRRKKDKLTQALIDSGITPIAPEGGFFIMGDTSKIAMPKQQDSDENVDWQFCRWLTTEIGVSPIPPSAFYSPENQHLASNLARFAFCKEDKFIDEAAKRLLQLKQYHKK